MTELTPKPSEWSTLDLPVLTEVADDASVPTLSAEDELDVPDFTPPPTAGKKPSQAVPELILDLPPDLDLEELLEDDSPPLPGATAEFAFTNLPSLDLEVNDPEGLTPHDVQLAAEPAAVVAPKHEPQASAAEDFVFDLNLEEPARATVAPAQPQSPPQRQSRAELGALVDLQEEWGATAQPTATATLEPVSSLAEHPLWDELPLSDNWDVAPPDIPASVLVDIRPPALMEESYPELTEGFEPSESAETSAADVPVLTEVTPPFGPATAAEPPADNGVTPAIAAEPDFEFVIEPKPVAQPEEKVAATAEPVELSFEPTVGQEPAPFLAAEYAVPPEMAEPDFESIAEPELAAPLETYLEPEFAALDFTAMEGAESASKEPAAQPEPAIAAVEVAAQEGETAAADFTPELTAFSGAGPISASDLAEFAEVEATSASVATEPNFVATAESEPIAPAEVEAAETSFKSAVLEEWVESAALEIEPAEPDFVAVDPETVALAEAESAFGPEAAEEDFEPVAELPLAAVMTPPSEGVVPAFAPLAPQPEPFEHGAANAGFDSIFEPEFGIETEPEAQATVPDFSSIAEPTGFAEPAGTLEAVTTETGFVPPVSESERTIPAELDAGLEIEAAEPDFATVADFEPETAEVEFTPVSESGLAVPAALEAESEMEGAEPGFASKVEPPVLAETVDAFELEGAETEFTPVFESDLAVPAALEAIPEMEDAEPDFALEVEPPVLAETADAFESEVAVAEVSLVSGPELAAPAEWMATQEAAAVEPDFAPVMELESEPVETGFQSVSEPEPSATAVQEVSPEFEPVELSFGSAVEPEPIVSAKPAPPPIQSIDIDSLPRGVLSSPFSEQRDPMAALQERLAEIHANLDSARHESVFGSEPAASIAEFPASTAAPLQSAKESFAAAALASEQEDFSPESFPDLASVAAPAQPAPDTQGEAVAVVGEDVLIESLYHTILPRMKVELGLWLQDALALQSKQLLSGVMQQLKEDYDQMFGETLRESLRQAITDVGRIEHKDVDLIEYKDQK